MSESQGTKRPSESPDHAEDLGHRNTSLGPLERPGLERLGETVSDREVSPPPLKKWRESTIYRELQNRVKDEFREGRIYVSADNRIGDGRRDSLSSDVS